MKITRPVQLFTMTVLTAIAIQPLHADDAAEAKKPRWESSLTLGATVTSGNSDSIAGTLAAKTEKKWEKNELKFGADGTYGRNNATGDTVVDKNTARGYGQYNRLFSKRLYGFVLADGMFDDVAMISYQVTVSPGLGYYFIKEPATSLSVQVGPGYVWKKLRNTPVEGVTTEDDYASLRVAEEFSHQFSDRVKVWEKADWTPSLEDFDQYTINFEAGVSSYITADKKLALSVIFYDTYNSVVATGKEYNDAKLVVGLTYAF